MSLDLTTSGQLATLLRAEERASSKTLMITYRKTNKSVLCLVLKYNLMSRKIIEMGVSFSNAHTFSMAGLLLQYLMDIGLGGMDSILSVQLFKGRI